MTGSSWMGWLGALLISTAMAGAVGILASSRSSYVRQMWGRYEYRLDQELRGLMMTVSGAVVARRQLAIGVALAALVVVTGNLLFLVGVALAAILPLAWLGAKRRQRVTKLEQQLDSWLQLLASALRASGSVASAVESSASLVPEPLRQELDLLMKKMQLGVPLERALMEMGARCESQTVSGALAAIIIGQRTGGDVPALLERAAASLREMARLEGLVRAKTAEGKLQATVLAIVPLLLVAALHSMQPTWFEPLHTTRPGYLMVGIAAALWLASVFMARKILQVEE